MSILVIICNINTFFHFNINRVDRVKVQYLYGRQEMEAAILIRVIVMDIQTVYILSQFQVSLKLGMEKLISIILLFVRYICTN